jgi:hypothetical protein
VIDELLGLVILGSTNAAIEKAEKGRRWVQIFLLILYLTLLAGLVYIIFKYS